MVVVLFFRGPNSLLPIPILLLYLPNSSLPLPNSSLFLLCPKPRKAIHYFAGVEINVQDNNHRPTFVFHNVVQVNATNRDKGMT